MMSMILGQQPKHHSKSQGPQRVQDKRDVALKVMALGKWGDNETRIQDEIIKTVQDTSRLIIYTATFFLPETIKVTIGSWCSL